MPIWRITPTAHPDDSRWQDREIWAEVIVEAPNAAFARLYARALDGARDRRVGNESLGPKSGFEDEKLYQVRRCPDGMGAPVATGGGQRILSAWKAAVD